MRTMCFFYESLKRFREVGAVAKSSRYLARAMAQEVNGSSNVVEFGAGTGPVTAEILKALPVDGQLSCFEINKKFCKDLCQIDDPRLKVINDDVENASQYVDSFDCIISGLPLAIFHKAKRDVIFDMISQSKTYIQLQYTPLLRKRFESYFTDVRLKFEMLNIPPAFIYVCKNNGNR